LKMAGNMKSWEEMKAVCEGVCGVLQESGAKEAEKILKLRMDAEKIKLHFEKEQYTARNLVRGILHFFYNYLDI